MSVNGVPFIMWNDIMMKHSSPTNELQDDAVKVSGILQDTKS